MLKKESIKKVIRLLNEKEREYNDINVEDIALCISDGNKKIGRVLNVSLPPIKTCPNCKECMFYCYDVKACLQYPNTVIDARIRNYTILKKDRKLYFETIEKAIAKRRTNKYFRWHVSGDIVDIDYLENMIEIAKRHSDFIFWTYTKNYKVVNEYCEQYGKESIPKNLSIMFSEWVGLKMENPYKFAEFKFVPKDTEDKPKGFYCLGNCDLCKAKKLGCIGHKTTYVLEH